MTCLCLEPYNNGSPLLTFVCGHVVHAECASLHIANRLNVGGDPSCPICNVEGEACGRVYFNIGEEDVEAYLTSHPDIFAALVNRHPEVIFHGHEIRANQEATIAQNVNNFQQMLNFTNNVENTGTAHGGADSDGDFLEFPRLRMNMRVNSHGILLTPRTPLHWDSDDDMDELNEVGRDLEIPHMDIAVRADEHALSFSLMEHDEDDQEDDYEDDD